MTGAVSETLVVQRLLPQLQAEGYEVFVNPSQSVLPTFFGKYHPDLIALRQDRNVAIEIQHPNDRTEHRLSELAELFKDRADWEFRVVWISPSGSEGAPGKQSFTEIERRLDEVDKLIEASHFEAAFLLCWAILEALGRAMLESEFQRPQTPVRVVEVLAARGVLLPREADALRRLIDKRNLLVHGELDVGLSRRDSETMLGTLRAVIASNRPERHDPTQ